LGRKLDRQFTMEVFRSGPHRRTPAIATIIQYLRNNAFQPNDVKAMSMALDDVCKELKLDGDETAKETVTVRIIELARRGERSPTRLHDRLLREVNGLTSL
jgi:hypothetical protein